METQSPSGLTTQKKMLPPQAATFLDREELIKYVRNFGANQGYVVTIKKSRRDRRVILGCDRGGVYRNRRKIDESKRKRKANSRLINCPFEAIGKKEVDAWVLTIKNGDHNHEPLKDMTEHPCNRRFSEGEVRQIKLMTEAGIKPRQVLKALKQSNPELQSTPRHLYNLKAKIRQGNLSEKSFTTWRPNRSVPLDAATTTIGGAAKKNNQPLKIHNFVGGIFSYSKSCSTIDVINPATQEVVSLVPLTTYEEFKAAVNVAKQTFPSWKNTPITTRQRIMFKLLELIRRDIDKLAMNIVAEQGKTQKGAKGDVLRSLEVVEHACGMATLQLGEFISNASGGIDTYCIREPLGVCAGICPFNFPAMTPLWMFPVAVTCGNTFVLKPCEKNPGASMMLAALAAEAGLPDGVLNIVHGTRDILNYICDEEDIKAISFVDSSTVGLHICAQAAARGKRVQSNIGGQNHAIIMPDASMDASLNALVATGFGAAGQRCMTLSTVVFVGGSLSWEQELVERVKALKVNVGTDLNADLGPVISKEVKAHICDLVKSSVDSGAKLLLDGRDILVPGYEIGNFIGPTILSDVTINMECYKEEIFGPVLLCMQAESLDEAITIINRNKHANGASIFTTSGISARKFQSEVEAEMVGINAPVPIPPLPSFNGRAGLEFYTHIKTVAQQWKELSTLRIPVAIPSSSETSVRSEGLSSVPSTSAIDSLNNRLTTLMPPAFDMDSPSNRVVLSIPPSSETDLPNPVTSSISSTTDRDFPGQGVPLVLPSSSERDSPNQDAGGDLPIKCMSERIYMPHMAQWDETPSATSQRMETMPTASGRIHGPAPQSQRIKAQASQAADASLDLASELYMSPCHGIGRVTHRKDSVALPSHRIENPTSERPYMRATSHLNGSMGQTFRTDTTLHSSTERLYMPSISHRNDHMGSTSHRTDISLQPTADDSIYMSGVSQRNDSVGPATQRVDSSASPSERMYISSVAHRNAGMQLTSEWLCNPTPATSQMMYSQGSVLSEDEFPSQGAR